MLNQLSSVQIQPWNNKEDNYQQYLKSVNQRNSPKRIHRTLNHYNNLHRQNNNNSHYAQKLDKNRYGRTAIVSNKKKKHTNFIQSNKQISIDPLLHLNILHDFPQAEQSQVSQNLTINARQSNLKSCFFGAVQSSNYQMKVKKSNDIVNLQLQAKMNFVSKTNHKLFLKTNQSNDSTQKIKQYSPQVVSSQSYQNFQKDKLNLIRSYDRLTQSLFKQIVTKIGHGINNQEENKRIVMSEQKRSFSAFVDNINHQIREKKDKKYMQGARKISRSLQLKPKNVNQIHQASTQYQNHKNKTFRNMYRTIPNLRDLIFDSQNSIQLSKGVKNKKKQMTMLQVKSKKVKLITFKDHMQQIKDKKVGLMIERSEQSIGDPILTIVSKKM